jgi:peptide/nickel transport system permease protein
MSRRLARYIVLGFVLAALFADCLAGDRPILMSVGGDMHLLSELPADDGEGSLRGEALSEALSDEDWALWPVMRWSPSGIRHEGRIEVLRAPSREHWLGTDDRGRDVASRLIHGARLSLRLALGCALLASLLGCLLALMAASRSWLDSLVLSLCDAIAALPPLLAVVVVGGLVGGQSLWALIILISIPRAAVTARTVRDGLHAALGQPFCESARAVGCSQPRLLLRHALPQCWPQLRVAAGLTAATAVLAEVALSFLGLTAAGSDPSWGELLRQAHENGLLWWLLVPAGVLTSLWTWALGRMAQDD